MLPASEPSLIDQALSTWQQNVMDKEGTTMREMTRQWINVEDRLRGNQLDLAMYLDELRGKGETITQARLMQMQRYQQLIRESREQVYQYADWANVNISNWQEDSLDYGIQSSQDLIRAAAAESGMAGLAFDHINSDAVDYAIGYAADGSPLYSLLQASYPDSVMDLTGKLVSGLGAGLGPRTTAKMMADSMAGNLQRAMLIAVTEQNRALRTASLTQMEKSNVVKGYIRRSQRNDHVCPACLALDGEEIEGEDLDFASHPRCHCFAQPMLKFGKTPQFQNGEEWLAQQPESTQLKVLGEKRMELYKSGKLNFGELSKIEHDPTWGLQVRTGSGTGTGSRWKFGKSTPPAPKGPKIETPEEYQKRRRKERKAARKAKAAEVPPPAVFGKTPIKGDPNKTFNLIETNKVSRDWMNYNKTWKDIYAEPGAQKHQICSTLAKRTKLPYETVNNAIHQWAYTSNDSAYASLEMQKVAARMNGTKLSSWQSKKLKAALRERKKLEGARAFSSGHEASCFEKIVRDPVSGVQHIVMNPEVVAAGYKTSEAAAEAFLKEMYSYTQEQFKASGVTHVRLYRGNGVSSDVKKALTKSYKERTAVRFEANAMESWSINKNIASSFENGGVIFTADVPIERVIGTCRTGFGCLSEEEFVVLNGLDDELFIEHIQGVY